MSKLNRRQFLTGAAGMIASAPWWSKLAFAQAGPVKRNMIIVMVGGGWDVSYALDPKPGLSTVDAPSGDVKFFGRLPIFVDDSRPAVESFFGAFGDISAVINGIEVSSIAHPECTKRILTGTNNEANPDLGAIVGHELGADFPVPYLALGSAAFAGEFSGSTGRTGVTNQLVALLDPQDAYQPTQRSTPFRPDGREESLVRRYLEDRVGAVRGGLGAGSKNQDQLDDFVTGLDRADRLSQFRDSFGDRGVQLTLDQQFDLAAKLIEGGVCRSIITQDLGQWDTHQNNAAQGPLHQQLYGALGRLAENLGRKRLLEDTVVVVLSEMSRTPKINGQRGKDHWPVTSALVFGGGVAGGRAYGATSDKMDAEKIDVATGRPDEGGRVLRTEHLVAGVIKVAGADPEPYFPGVAPLDAIVA